MNIDDISNSAYQFRIDNNLNTLTLNYQDLYNICKEKNWTIIYYGAAKEFLVSMGKYHYTVGNKAFTIFQNGKITIYLNEKLSMIEKKKTLAHEIAHIYLNHTCYDIVLGRSEDNNLASIQEDEAEEFALYLLAPPCLLKKLKYNSPADIEHSTNINREDAEYIIGKMADLYLVRPTTTELKLIHKYETEIKKLNNVKWTKLKNKFLILFITICLTFSIVGIGISVKKNINLLTRNPDPPIISTQEVYYMTRSGEKYHKQDCPYIKNKDVLEITLEEISKHKWEPCKYCIGNSTSFDN